MEKEGKYGNLIKLFRKEKNEQKRVKPFLKRRKEERKGIKKNLFKRRRKE